MHEFPLRLLPAIMGGALHLAFGVWVASRSEITHNEEIDLARIAEAHALSPSRALQLHHEVEEPDVREGAT